MLELVHDFHWEMMEMRKGWNIGLKYDHRRSERRVVGKNYLVIVGVGDDVDFCHQ